MPKIAVTSKISLDRGLRWFSSHHRLLCTFSLGDEVAFKPQSCYWGEMGNGWIVSALDPNTARVLLVDVTDPAVTYNARETELAMLATHSQRRAFRYFVFNVQTFA